MILVAFLYVGLGPFFRIFIAYLITQLGIASVWAQAVLYVSLYVLPLLLLLFDSSNAESRKNAWYHVVDQTINTIILIAIPLSIGIPIYGAATSASFLSIGIAFLYPILIYACTNAHVDSSSTNAYLPKHLPPPLIVKKDRKSLLPVCETTNRPITLPVTIGHDNTVFDFMALVNAYSDRNWHHPTTKQVISHYDIKLHQNTWNSIQDHADNRQDVIIPEEPDSIPQHIKNHMEEECPIMMCSMYESQSPVLLDTPNRRDYFDLSALHKALRDRFIHPITRQVVDPLTLQHHPYREKRDNELSPAQNKKWRGIPQWCLTSLLICGIHYAVCMALGLLVTLRPLFIDPFLTFALAYSALGLASQYIRPITNTIRHTLFQVIKHTAARDSLREKVTAYLALTDEGYTPSSYCSWRSTLVKYVCSFMLMLFMIMFFCDMAPFLIGSTTLTIIGIIGLIPTFILTTFALKAALCNACHYLCESCLPDSPIQQGPTPIVATWFLKYNTIQRPPQEATVSFAQNLARVGLRQM